MKLYTDEDADLSHLRGKVVGIIGYGNQGSAQAKCLREAGLNVIVGVREDGPSWGSAENDRMAVMGIAEAAKKADIICMLVPDLSQREVYEQHVKAGLSAGKVLCFAHGFNITYGLIKPPRGVDVVLLSPKSTGSELREAFLHEEGVPGLVAVHQDASRKAKKIVLALAKAMRMTKKAVFECTFDQETFANLFAEQCVTIGGQMALVKAGYDTMVKNGIPPEIAYFECIGVTRTIIDMVEKHGLKKMLYGISRTAGYGAMTRGVTIVGEREREAMQAAFNGVKDGSFAEEWLHEYDDGLKHFDALRRKESDHPLEHVGAKLRKALGEER